MRKRWRVVLMILYALGALHASRTPAVQAQDLAAPVVHVVYTLSNAPANAVIRYQQKQGKPWTMVSYATGGQGTGGTFDVAGGAVALSPDGQFLCAVNPGSDSVSVFRVEANNSLTLLGQPVRALGFPLGVQPRSVVISSANRAYVLFGNPGDTPSITAFAITTSGLSEIAGSGRSFGSAGSDVRQLALGPSENVLAITDRARHLINTFTLDAAGLPSAFDTINFASGIGPFGLGFNNFGSLFVAEANTSTLSSYAVANGQLSPVSRSVRPGLQEGTSRAVATANSRFVFTSNSLSRTISRYDSSRVGVVGTLTLGHEIAGQPTRNPYDLALSPRTATAPQFLYVLNRDAQNATVPVTIDLFQVDTSTGTLSRIATLPSAPATATGLAAKL